MANNKQTTDRQLADKDSVIIFTAKEKAGIEESLDVMENRLVVLKVLVAEALKGTPEETGIFLRLVDKVLNEIY